MRVRRLVMLRHGQTEWNAGSRMQGQLDTDLTDLGRAQAVAAAEVLAKRQPLLIVSSDLRRALETAEALGERTGVEVDVDTRLRETHLGDWQGLTHIDVDAMAPGARLAYGCEGPQPSNDPPGGPRRSPGVAGAAGPRAMAGLA